MKYLHITELLLKRSHQRLQTAAGERRSDEINARVLLPHLTTLTFYTEQSISRRNSTSIFSLCIALPLISSSLLWAYVHFSTPPLPPLFLYPEGTGCMQKHCGSLSFKTPFLKIAPFFFSFFFSSQSAERDGGLI